MMQPSRRLCFVVLLGLLLLTQACSPAVQQTAPVQAAEITRAPVEPSPTLEEKETPTPTITQAPPTPTAAEVPAGYFLLPENDVTSRQHFSPDGTLVGISAAEKIYVFTTSPFQLAYTLNAPGGSNDFAFSAYGTYGAVAIKGTADVLLFDPKTGAPGVTLHGDRASITSLVFSADERKLVGVTNGNGVNIWDPAAGTLLGWVGHNFSEGRLSLSSNGEVASLDGQIFYTGSDARIDQTQWMYSSDGTYFTPFGLCIRLTLPSLQVAHGPDYSIEAKTKSGIALMYHFVTSSQDERNLAIKVNNDTLEMYDAMGKLIRSDTIPGNTPGLIKYVIMDAAFDLPATILYELVKDQSTLGKDYFFIRQVPISPEGGS